MRLALEQGLHTSSTFEEQQRGNVCEGERYREAWWTVYMLDRHMSSLMGAPVALADDEITAQLPSFAGYPQKRVALEMQVRLSRVTTLILRSKLLKVRPKYEKRSDSRTSRVWPGWTTHPAILAQHERSTQDPGRYQ